MENPYPNKNSKIPDVSDKKQGVNPFEILAKLSSQTFKPNKNQKVALFITKYPQTILFFSLRKR